MKYAAKLICGAITFTLAFGLFNVPAKAVENTSEQTEATTVPTPLEENNQKATIHDIPLYFQNDYPDV